MNFAHVHETLDDWIAREAISFSIESPESFNAAVDSMIGSLDDSVELLGLGEPLHGAEVILRLRNRLFQRLVEKHGYSAIAIESSFPRGRLVNEFVSGHGTSSYDEVQKRGFSHGFGEMAANRELVEWMRTYNADPSHSVKLWFYGFDSPTERVGSDSPRQLLTSVLDYVDSIDRGCMQERRRRIEGLLGADSDWENPAASFDPSKSIGSSPAPTALRIETEDLITELSLRRPELISKSDQDSYGEAAHSASVARQLLNYHAELSRASSDRISRLLGIRDVMMADNLVYMVARERGRGKVLAFAHNTHLQRGQAQWQWGTDVYAWWPAGSHVHQMLGSRYATIGLGVGVWDAQGIGQPEAGTLEARLMPAPGSARFIPTHRGEGISATARADLAIRSGSAKNSSYFPLTPQSFSDFDGLFFVGRYE